MPLIVNRDTVSYSRTVQLSTWMLYPRNEAEYPYSTYSTLSHPEIQNINSFSNSQLLFSNAIWGRHFHYPLIFGSISEKSFLATERRN